LVREIGDGAFGTVWRARDTESGCEVAIKIFSCGSARGVDMSYMLRESRVAGQLVHPNIVRILDAGSQGEYRYMVSELIEGLGLDAWLRRFPCVPRQAAQWCATIARALQYAHDAGVIHRDLKPANIMIDHAGTLHVMDFGLAKHEWDALTSDIERYQLAAYRLRHTQATANTGGPLLGTPAYMSPEQASGDGYFVDHRTDIYSLGVVLYELLAGKRPFRGHPLHVMRSIRRRDPMPPRWLNRHAPRSLEAICLKAMARRVDNRFTSAQELAEECERFVDGLPTQTRPLSQPRLALRWLFSCLSLPRG
jgi:serine/threonine protein kinase